AKNDMTNLWEVKFGLALLVAAVIGTPSSFGRPIQIPSQSSRLEFEVASVKVNARDVLWQDTRENCGLNGMGSVNILSDGRVKAQRSLLSCVIQGAYVVRPFQILGGPDWINSIHYDVDAKATNGNATPEQLRLMLQTL